jgi:hypothetical protein
MLLGGAMELFSDYFECCVRATTHKLARLSILSWNLRTWRIAVDGI